MNRPLKPAEKIDLVFLWKRECPRSSRFDVSFVRSLQRDLEQKGALSFKQEAVLEKILVKFGIKEWAVEQGYI